MTVHVSVTVAAAATLTAPSSSGVSGRDGPVDTWSAPEGRGLLK